MQNKIYIGNLTYNATEDDLRSAFEGFGQINGIKIPFDREHNRPRGFAFVEFASPEHAQAALEMHGKELLGRELKVNMAKEQERR